MSLIRKNSIRPLGVISLPFLILLLASPLAKPVHAGGDLGLYAGDTAQMGYTASYTGTGTLTAVQVDLDTLPSLSLNYAIMFILNTGEISTDCVSANGFMQDAVQYDTSLIGYQEIYMNGAAGCFASAFSNQASPQIASGHRIWLEILYSLGNTYYYVKDLSTGAMGYQVVSSLSSWNYNSFQTMTESMGHGTGSISSFYYDKGNVSNGVSTYPVGGPSTSVSGSYGGVCAGSDYVLGSWSTSIYGYNQPSFTIFGNCGLRDVTPTNHVFHSGVVNNPTYASGTPNYYYAEIRGPNPTDGGFVIIDLTQLSSGQLNLFAYSFNNGAGAYSSNVIVSVSSDRVSWTVLSSSVWSPAPSNVGTWHNLGSVSSIRYVNVTAWDNPANNYSADLLVGAVAVA